MRSWAEINLDALENNIKEIRRVTNPDSKIMAVIKADAYGHGFFEVAETLAENGADCFAVAVAEEALQIRSAGFSQDILILGSVDMRKIDKLIENNISLCVYDFNLAKEISDCAAKHGKKVKVHIKIDTGMARIGYLSGVGNDKMIIDEIIKISQLQNIFIEGIFTHFSTADETDECYTRLQFERFMSICGDLESAGLNIPIRHAANSAAILKYPEMHLDMVRPGIILYGLYPSDEIDKNILKLTPVMTFKSRITHVKEVPSGIGVSYGKEYITDCSRLIATVPVGYADGYIRKFAGCGKMLLKNQKVKIVGRICMDQCMIDVTNVNNISKGDEVTIFTDREITADDLASWADTINYEIVCMISKRIPRIYLKDGRKVKEVNYLT